MNNVCELPQSWCKAKLPEIILLNPTINKVGIADNLDVSFVPMSAVQAESGVIDVDNTRKFSEVKKGYTPFLEGDVLFAKITPCMENGKMAIVPALINNIGFGSTEFHVFRSLLGVDKKYLYYFVSSQSFRRDAEHNMSGAVGQRRVTSPYLNTCDIPLPPTQEQHRIVAKIEELFSELDQGVKNLKTAQAQLKVYRQALLKQAFEGKLTEQWRRDNQDQLESASDLQKHIQDERSQRYQQQLQEWEANGKQGSKPRAPKELPPLSAEELAELPELKDGWKWVRVGEIADVQLGRQRSPSNRSNHFPTKYVRAGNITESGLDLTDVLDMEFDPQERERFLLKFGDVLLSEASGSASQVGKPAIWREEIANCCFQNTVIRVRSIAELSDYLFWIFKTYYVTGVFSKLSGGVGINHLSAGKLESMAIPIIGNFESVKVLEVINEKLSLIENIDHTITTALKQSEALRQSILKKAFSGELVPQDANDEPASVLLARIKAEKSAAVSTPRKKVTA